MGWGVWLQHLLRDILKLICECDRPGHWISQFNTALRTLDALHLAIAVSNDLRLITADEGLAQAADALGIAYQLLAV